MQFIIDYTGFKEYSSKCLNNSFSFSGLEEDNHGVEEDNTCIIEVSVVPFVYCTVVLKKDIQ